MEEEEQEGMRFQVPTGDDAEVSACLTCLREMHWLRNCDLLWPIFKFTAKNTLKFRVEF